MKPEELTKGLKVLELAYGKEFTPEESSTYYEFLGEYSYETFKTAVKNIIRSNKFMPKISDLIEACEGAKTQTKYDVIEFMKQMGYFKHPREYEKTMLFMERNIVPEWLQNDINTYYKMMQQERLGTNEQLKLR